MNNYNRGPGFTNRSTCEQVNSSVCEQCGNNWYPLCVSGSTNQGSCNICQVTVQESNIQFIPSPSHYIIITIIIIVIILLSISIFNRGIRRTTNTIYGLPGYSDAYTKLTNYDNQSYIYV